MLARPLLAVGAIVGVTAFAAPRPPKAPHRYTESETIHREVDLTGAGGPKQVEHAQITRFISLTLLDSAGGRKVTLVIDSVRLDTVSAEMAPPPGALDSIRGSTATGFIDATGKLQNIAGEGLRGTMAGQVLQDFFPTIGPRVKVGDRWTDTTEGPGHGDQVLAAATVRRVTNWIVNSEEMMAGVKARKVDAAFSQSMTGELQNPQGTLGIDGTGTGTATYYLGPDGFPAGARWSLTLQVSLSTSQAPEPIPMTGTTAIAITAIR
jgi:hypothetical protein